MTEPRYVRSTGDRLILWCPGCEGVHQVWLAPGWWKWDGNETAPTITPSILVRGTQWSEGAHFRRGSHTVPPGAETRCHSFVRAGCWEYLSDSTHTLVGQTVPVVPLPDWMTDPTP